MTTLLKGDLRPYQKDAVKAVKEYPNVLIADEMGLGKTVEAIALDMVRRIHAGHQGRTLVVAPLTGVVDSWVRHFEEWTDLPVFRMDNKNKKTRAAFIEKIADNETGVFVCHWDGMRLEHKQLAMFEWLHVIADEAHKLKNRKSQQTKAMKKIRRVGYKTALTGTPIINRPDEIWSILHWLYVSKKERVHFLGEEGHYILNSYWRFYEAFCEYIMVPPDEPVYKKVIDTKNEAALQQLMAPFYVRRTKKVALPDLPDKYYTDIWVELTGPQKRAYDQMKEDLIAWVGEHEDDPVVAPIVISQLIRLQQFALSYAELEDREVTRNGEKVTETRVRMAEPSVKLDACMNVLEDIGDSQVVIFSQFTQAIEMLCKRLDKAKISYGKITGSVPQASRTRYINEFQNSELQVMACNIRAGGVGIDLYASSTVIFLDRSWSPADNKQAEDRLHRSGQKNAVQVIDIMAERTIDVRRRKGLELKWTWIKNIIGE